MDENKSGIRSGSAYIFELVMGGMVTVFKKLMASDGAFGDSFWYFSIINLTKALIGAYGDNNPSKWISLCI
ncbi:MAG: hypothetical protein R3F25_09950 [Gammaproteobacteria bacterium]